LIELMIVVVVIAILAAVALPNYSDYVRRSRRADAHAMLQAAQLAQEKWRLSNTTYTATVSDLTGVTGTSEGGYYTLGIANNTATGYTLTASAVNGTTQANDTGCTSITIALAAGVTTYGPSNTCWNK
jgi:type IV pilus assembly protein PilE